MSILLQQVLKEINQLTPEEQWQVMGHLMNQLQHRAIVIAKPDKSSSDSAQEQWDEQIANDLETGRLNQLIAKAEADIKANQVRIWMKSFATPDFWRAYSALSPELKEKARKAYQLWKENQLHPSLHFKKVGKTLWSVRITQDYRALALKKGDDYYWIWIGSHDEYEALLK